MTQDGIITGPVPTTAPPPGFYADGQGRERWWDGVAWTDVYKPASQAVQPQQHAEPTSRGPMTHGALEVKREVSYVRAQTPHSFTKHLLFGWMLLWIPTIYYAVSPNHYFRA